MWTEREMSTRENEIRKLNDEVGALKIKIKDLEKYAIHYDLEMSLRHGIQGVLVQPKFPE